MLGAMATFRWRLAFVMVVCLILATEVLAQPSVFEHWSFGEVASGLLEYYLQCLGFGVSILLAVTAAEHALPRLPSLAQPLAIPIAVLCGALFGGLIDIAFHELGLAYIETARFIGDVMRWSLLGAGVVGIYVYQRRAAASAARLHKASIERLALDRQMLEARLQVMRAQIEPHFLFNSLANVKRLCEENVEQGITMIDNLVRYLRAALPRLRASAATLGQEADLVHAYLDVQRIRMGNYLAYSLDVPPPLRELPFPPMMLLTLTENAIKHGLAPSADAGRIEITAQQTARELIVSVADTGVGFGGAKTSGSGIGLANTRARLRALFGDGADLELCANQPRGVIARIRVPIVQLSRAATLYDTA